MEEEYCEYCGDLIEGEAHEDNGFKYCHEDCMIEDSKDPEKDEFN